jgi:hypothetical protein
LVGLIIKGKSYDPYTYEISLNEVEGKVISKGISTFRFWNSNNNEWISLPVGFYYCSLFDGTEYNENIVVAIPAFLISSITDAEIDDSISDYVSGYPFYFSSELPYAIEDNINNCNAAVIEKSVLPVPYFKDSDKTQFSTSDFFICYEVSSISPLSINQSSIKFIDPIKCTYVNPSYGASKESNKSNNPSSSSGIPVGTSNIIERGDFIELINIDFGSVEGG